MIQPILPNVSIQSRKPAAKLQSPKADTPTLRFGAGTKKAEVVHQFMDAALNGDAGAIQGFLHGPIARGELDINVRNDEGYTALSQAVIGQKAQVVNMLLESGADPNIPARYFRTPLYHAADRQNPDILKRLLQAGADLDFSDEERTTPLHKAVQCANKAAIPVLMEAKADLNAKDYRGFTPLHYAALNGNGDIVVWLLADKADHTLKSKQGYTPVQLAIAQEHFAVAKSILQNTGSFPPGLSEDGEKAYLKALAIKVEVPAYLKFFQRLGRYFNLSAKKA